MRLAIATCSDLPEREVDDQPLHQALERRGVDARLVVWDDAGVDWRAFDACLIRTTWDYTERRDEYVDWAERVSAQTALFNRAELVRWNTHKRYLRDLSARGVPVVETVWLDRGGHGDLRKMLADRGWGRGFIKPAIGATARETMRFEADGESIETAQRHLDRLLAREDVLVQPYLARVETEGEVSAIFIDREVTHTVRKRPVPGDYRVQDDFGASDGPVTFAEADLALARRAVDAIEGDLVYARTDFLRDDEGSLRLTELELVEPSLFFRHAPHAADALAEAVCRRVV